MGKNQPTVRETGSVVASGDGDIAREEAPGKFPGGVDVPSVYRDVAYSMTCL